MYHNIDTKLELNGYSSTVKQGADCLVTYTLKYDNGGYGKYIYIADHTNVMNQINSASASIKRSNCLQRCISYTPLQ